MPKYVYDFTEGNRDLRDLLGGKGANLAEMNQSRGCRCPPASPSRPRRAVSFLADGVLPEGLEEEIAGHLSRAGGRAMGRGLGQADDPLLVSVRSRGRVLRCPA
ncbi:hypothetical protein GCM10017559_71920 [Streptosporangium longisporum]|uniref:Pyruvate phosphate dikinase AMP/ATP-binding domain-containing protein n=1 Tax=Streptosporangium longisporum TaxID=46187 RepID=A0ABP6L6A2_9ACTN